MANIWNAGSPFHFQSDPDWCGPASAMMVLARLGVSMNMLIQRKLYDSIRLANCSPSGGRWRSDPCGVEAVLNAFTPGEWHFYLRNDLAEATRDIVYSLRERRRPSVALIYGVHWVVVNSVATTSDPTQGPYSVKALWLHNPSPDARINPPASHDANDICGSRAVSDKVSWREWETKYLLAKKDDLWNRKPRFVVISDSEERESFRLPTDPEEGRPAYIDPAAVPSRARLHLSSQLEEDPEDPNRDTLNETVNAVPESPFHVFLPSGDEEERLYYLVPFVLDGKVVATMKIDRRGLFRSLRFRQGEVASFSESDRADKRWIWLPCEESRSPHLPFMADHDLTRPDQGGRFVRLDGAVFSELTPLKDG